MEVFYKFKSAKDFDSLSIDWHYTTVSDVKEAVLKKKCSGKRNEAYYDRLMLFNADTDQEYLDGETLIEKNTRLVIHRAPKFPCLPIVFNPPVQLEESVSEEEDVRADESIYDEPSTCLYPTESEWIEFWNDLSPSTVLVPARAPISNKADKEKRKIKDLVDTNSSTNSFGAARGFGCGGMGGRSGGRGFGQGEFSDKIKPPLGYICYRCEVPGHFIQHCPTNGDTTFDIKRTMASSYALSGGGVAVLKPSETTSEKSIQGMPSTCYVAKIPAELYCPLCKVVMKDAVFSKCCFKSFCDKCIRDYVMSKSQCICGAINVLVGDPVPNKTVRDTIVRFLKTANSNEDDHGGSTQSQDKESAPGLQPRIPCSSAPSKGVLPPLPFKSSTVESVYDRKHKASEDSCITFPEAESPVFKRRKLGVFGLSNHRSSSTTSNGCREDQCNTAAAVLKKNYNYADDHIFDMSDDRHFERWPSRFEPSPGPAMVNGRHSSRGLRAKGVIAASIGRLSVY